MLLHQSKADTISTMISNWNIASCTDQLISPKHKLVRWSWL